MRRTQQTPPDNNTSEATVKPSVLARSLAARGMMQNQTKNDPLSLHTDQQSLILGEMMTARNKLRDENETLRDKLYDAEMMIRYLQLKLLEYGDKDVEGLTKHAKRAGRESRRRALQTKVELALQWDPKAVAAMKSKEAKRKTANISNRRQRQAFVNDVAPGRKTFISPAEAARIATDEFSLSSPCATTLRACGTTTTKSTPSSHQSDVTARKISKNVQAEKNNLGPLAQRTVKEEIKEETDMVLHGATLRSKKNGDQMLSLMGKMAEAVITEYSNADDDFFILKN